MGEKIKQPKNHQTLTLKAATKVPMPPIIKMAKPM